MRSIQPAYGTTRIRTVFLWTPAYEHHADGSIESRWMEFAKVREVYEEGPGISASWVVREFINDGDEP